MLTDEELEQLLSRGESDLIEFTESAGKHVSDKIRQAICAFANDLARHGKPGVVIVGLRDDGTCAEIAIDDELLKRLAGFRDEGKILPFPVMTVEKRSLNGCEVALVIVEPAVNPPVKVDGRIWVRVGPTCRTASSADENLLLEKRRWNLLEPDAQPVPGAKLDELDLVRFRIEYLPSAVSPQVIEENSRTLEQQLMGQGFVFRDGTTPTRTGLLVVGIEPRRWMSGAYVQFRRVAGQDNADDTIDQEEIGGTVLDQVRRTEDILDINIKEALVIKDDRHQLRPTYPIEALRQIIRNAVLHRTYDASNNPVRVTWYDDRLEVQSPGGPYGSVTVENFGKPGVTDYRNPTLASAMKNLGLVERFGAGMGIIRRRLRENGNPEPELKPDQHFVLVTVRPVP